MKCNRRYPAISLAFLICMLCLSAPAQTIGNQDKAFRQITEKAILKSNSFLPDAGSDFKASTIFTPASCLHLVWNDAVPVWDSLEWNYYDYFWTGAVLVDSGRTYASSWSNSYKIENILDAENRLIGYVYYYWVSSTWYPNHKWAYSYNAENDFTSSCYLHWSGSVWDTLFGSRLTHTYDTDGNELTSEIEEWSASGWFNSRKYIYTYSTSGDMLTYIHQIWATGAWENFEQVTYSYNVSGEISTVLDELWLTGAWVPQYRYIDIAWYDYSLELLTHYLTQEWSGSAWADVADLAYTYGINDSYIAVEQQPDSTGSLANLRRYTYNSDVFGNNTLNESETWISGIWSLESGGRYSYVYDPDGNILSQVEEVIAPLLGDTTYRNTDKYVYFNYTVGTSAPVAGSEISVWPNPSSNDINFSLPTGEWTFSVISATGASQTVAAENTGNDTWLLAMDHLSAGIYFVEAQNGDRHVRRKIVLQ